VSFVHFDDIQLICFELCEDEEEPDRKQVQNTKSLIKPEVIVPTKKRASRTLKVKVT